jgi:hypothetical protein
MSALTDLPVPESLGPGHPVLETVLPVVAASDSVSVDLEQLEQHAGWLAYEELPYPRFLLPFPLELDRDGIIDFLLVANLLNFAFTDFETGRRWEVEVDGVRYSDSDGLLACLYRALVEGIDILDGAYLRSIRVDDLRHILRAETELQMLDERAEILRAAGASLANRYEGRFHNFVASASPALYDDGNGLLETLVREFPRFGDAAEYGGRTVRFDKLAQLVCWMLHVSLPGGSVKLRDVDRLTAFADYIVPAALRLLGIVRYDEELDEAIWSQRVIEAGSAWEVEIRAHTIYATALLTDAVNRLRPAELQVIVPQIDARLWVPFHRTHWPHHLTRTIYY